MFLSLFNCHIFGQEEAVDETVDLTSLSLEELMEIEVETVSTASKYEQKVSEAPSSVTIITAEEIRKYGYRTLADVFNSVRGFYTTYDRNYHYVGVRGLGRPGDYNMRILMLIDGHRVNDNVGDSSSIGEDFYLDTALIKKIEIIHGPGSALYGSNAILAVVNIITKDGKDYDGVELFGEYGSYDAGRGRVTYGKVFENGMDVLISGSYFDKDGDTLYFKDFDDPATNYGKVDNDDEQSYRLFGKLTLDDLSLTVANVSREKGIPTAPWGGEFGDDRTRSWDDLILIGLTHNHDFSDKFSMKNRIAYNYYDYKGHWVYDDGGLYVNKDRWKGRWWEYELQFIAEPFERHKLTWGSEFRYNVRQDQRNWDFDIYLDDKQHSKNWGLYLQDEFKVLDNVTLIGGIRYDEYDTVGSTTNPRLALIYNYSDATTLKLLYGEAFRAPNAYELYYHDGYYTMKPPTSLESETIETYEIVLEQKFNKNITGSVSGFYYTLEDLIDQTVDPGDSLIVFTNTDEVEVKGLEFELDGRWENGLRSRASYSYVEAEDDSGSTIANYPEHMVKFNLITPLIQNKLFAGFETQYFSNRKTLSGHHADNYTIANLTLTYTNLVKGMDLQFGVYNICDKEYEHPGFAEHEMDVLNQDGRNYRVNLTYRF
jgi:iron complex outermembrane receptor protein